MTAFSIQSGDAAHAEPGHPERPARLEAVRERVAGDPLLPGLPVQRLEPAPDAPREALERVHTAAYLDRLDALCAHGGGALDGDTYTTPASARVARQACGGLLSVVDAVMSGASTNGFAVGRPPGHHARPGTGMGFCLLSNVAVAARHAQARWGAARVLVVDLDVHHGNGTEEAFLDDPSVVAWSTHGAGIYPGTGAESETGTGRGEGATVNVPLPAGTDDAGFLHAYRHLLPPLVARVRPDLILLAAGFDAHRLDPLGSLALSVAGLADVVRLVAEVADAHAGGRLVASLEGGYHAEALACGVVSTLRVLADPSAPPDDPFGPTVVPGPDTHRLVERIARRHGL